MQARKVIIVSVIVFIIITMGLMGKCSMDKGKAKENKEEIKKDSSKLLKVKVGTFTNSTKPLTVRGFGQVSSTALINISAEVQGIISTQVNLKKGTTFSKGQTLVTIRNEDVKLGLQARKSNYLTLISSILPDLKLDFPSSFNQWQDFYNAIEVDKPLPQIPTTKDFKEKNFISSKGIITEYYTIKSDEERLKKYVISAPFNGSILNAMTDEGAVVNPGTPIISILRDGNLEIEIPVNKNEIEKVKQGALVSLYDESSITAKGKVIRKGNYINAQTQTIPVFIEISETSSPLYNGVYLNAEIAAEGFETVMEIPRKALLNKTSVFIVENNLLKTIELEIVSYQKNTVYVKGVPDGTVIVVEPVINGKDGAMVEIVKTSK
jgi:multidrug efflux pump subunit AcrA (membrane-fusion protein)